MNLLNVLPKSGMPSDDLGIWSVTRVRIMAMVSKVVRPMVTFSSRSPPSLKGAKIPMMLIVVIMKQGRTKVNT